MIVCIVGLRMGMGALNLLRLGLLRKEFPRYQYQRLRWAAEGKSNLKLALQIDGIAQGPANASCLALPIFIIAASKKPFFLLIELMGLLISIVAFAIESIADFQKASSLREMKTAREKLKVCDIRLWRYYKHPIYFAEWMVWSGLVLFAVSSWLSLRDRETMMLWLFLGVGLLFTSKMVHHTLVYGTGAIPPEHFFFQEKT